MTKQDADPPTITFYGLVELPGLIRPRYLSRHSSMGGIACIQIVVQKTSGNQAYLC
jgi:hypothetical protein